MHSLHAGQSFPFGEFLLGKQQVMILFFIYEKKELASVKEIAKFLQVTPGAVTQFVDGLVEKKLVQREESKIDRRSITIRLTSGTIKKFDSFRKKYLEAASVSFDGLTNDELEQFIALVAKIKKPN